MTRRWLAVLLGGVLVLGGVIAIALVALGSSGHPSAHSSESATPPGRASTPSPTATSTPTPAATPTPTPTPTPTHGPGSSGAGSGSSGPGSSGSPTTHPPVAVSDTVDFDLRVNATTATGDLLTNDTDADGDALSAVPASGDFVLPGQTTTAGSYTIATDGTLTLIASSDPFGPLPKLAPGDTATVTLPYQVTDGAHTSTGSVAVDVTGRLDPYYAVAPIGGVGEGAVLSYGSAPTVFDASAVFASPDPLPRDTAVTAGDPSYSLSWSSASSVTVPPAFQAGAGDVQTVSVPNNEWGVGSAGTVVVNLLATDGRTASATVHFTVSDPSPTATPDTIDFDLRSDPDHVSANVLGNDSDAAGRSLAATAASGDWSIDGQSTVAGSYTVATDGTLTLTAAADPLGPLRRLAPGESATATLQYEVSNGSSSAHGAITVQLTGALDPYTAVAPIGGVTENQLLHESSGSITFDASQVFASADPVPHATALGGTPSYSLSWHATSTGSVPIVPAFLNNADVLTVSTPISGWGAGAHVTVTVTLTTTDGRTASATVDFDVAAAPVAVADSVPFNLSVDAQKTTSDLLANDTHAAGETLNAVPGSGSFSLDGQSAIAGTYAISADGTLTVTASDDKFGPLPKLAPGETATVTLGYTATNGSLSSPGEITVHVTGRLDPIYVVGPIGGIRPGMVIDSSLAGSITADSANVFDSPDGLGSDELQWDGEAAGVPIASGFGPTVTIDNSVWNFGDTPATLTLTIVDTDTSRTATATVDFAAGNLGGAGNSRLIVNDDTLPFDLQRNPTGVALNVLTNDVAGFAAPLAIVPDSGTWSIDGQAAIAGDFVLGADGVLHLTPSSDPFGPLAQLGPGQTATATLNYTDVEGPVSGTATVTVPITGRLDPYYAVNPIGGVAEDATLDAGASSPTVFDAAGVFDSPDPGLYHLAWSASTSSGSVPAAFAAAGDVTSVSVPNGDWAPDSSDSVTVTLTAQDGRTAERTVHFAVSSNGNTPGAPIAVHDSVEWDLRVDAHDAAGQVLANDLGPAGSTLSVVPASGDFTLDGQTTAAGSYSVAADGALTLQASSDNFGPLPKLAPGEVATVTLPYALTDGTETVPGTVTVTVTGRLDPYYAVNPMRVTQEFPPGSVADNGIVLTTAGIMQFDATNLFASPDPLPHAADAQTGDPSFRYSWSSTSDVNAQTSGDFSGFDEIGASVIASQWGSFSHNTATVTLITTDGRTVSQSFSFQVLPPGNHFAPVANPDTVPFDLRVDAQHASGNVVTNDTDADGDALSVTPDSGNFSLDGQSTVAGSYTIAADGSIELTASSDPFGPLPSLGDGQSATATLHYSVTDTGHPVTGTITVDVTGRLDPFVQVAPILGISEGQLLDVTKAAPTVIDASSAFASADGGTPVFHWSATSTGTVPNDPAFASDADVSSVSVLDSAWGPNSTNSISVSASGAGRPASAPITVHFTVSDHATNTHTPVAVDQTLSWTLQGAPVGVFSVLTGDTDADGDPLSGVPSSGTFTLPGQSTVAGGYQVTADGSLRLTPSADNFGPLPQLAPGETAAITVPYSITDGIHTASATATVTITGRLDPYYQVRAFMPDVDGQLLSFNDPNPTVFDASGLFASPDPGAHQLVWGATSSDTTPQDPAFTSNANVQSVSVLNAAWGFDSLDSVTVTLLPFDGRPPVSTTVHFGVSDGG